MGAVLETKEKRGTVIPCEMKDGQIGIIVSWTVMDLLGKLVQRWDTRLVVLGEPRGLSYLGLTNDPRCQVRILQPGEKIKIT